MNMKKFLQAIGFVLIAQSAGVLGSFFTVRSIESWYAFLDKPPLVPPNWVFAPAWLILYAIIGFSIFLIWNKRKEAEGANNAMVWFFAHLLLNAAWSPIFFGAQAVLFAFFVIILVFVTGVVVSVKFCKTDKLAGYLWVPYLAWVLFASYLNLGIYILN